ncbi:metaxin-3 [Anthonomus grandis grandis]|uniref:metaxin-3 n=1 Tax=Anthonomus grandis grandis TaxID=2921223 RepID=UPI0021661CBD|nr:metaxin-3 [Anthonomus grandis grandis]
MTANDKFSLYIYDGDYGLPSMHVDCIKSLLYTSIAKVPLQIKLLNNIKLCTFYSGPYFVHKHLSFGAYSEIVPYINTLGYNLDFELNPKQKSESLALSNMVQMKLRGPLEYVFWLDQRNFEEFTRVWFTRALPWPLSIFYINRAKETAENLIQSMYATDCSMEIIRDNLSALTAECLSSLSARLGTLSYFHGDSPTSLDVIVYSYVAPLLKVPFPSNSISSLVSAWPNLVSFVKRIEAKYLPEVPKESKYLKHEEQTKTSDDDVSYVAISLLTVSAVTLVVGFAMSRGFITSRMY